MSHEDLQKPMSNAEMQNAMGSRDSLAPMSKEELANTELNGF